VANYISWDEGCRQCDGGGAIGLSQKKCVNCNGTGIVTVTYDSEEGTEWESPGNP
jgi:DnaJ-class molecular chaperone